jgi:hypothetical protein
VARHEDVLKAPRAKDGDRAKKQFQFLNEVSACAIRVQLGRRAGKQRPHAVRRPVVRNERGRQLTQPSVDGSPPSYEPGAGLWGARSPAQGRLVEIFRIGASYKFR